MNLLNQWIKLLKSDKYKYQHEVLKNIDGAYNGAGLLTKLYIEKTGDGELVPQGKFFHVYTKTGNNQYLPKNIIKYFGFSWDSPDEIARNLYRWGVGKTKEEYIKILEEKLKDFLA